MPSERRRRQRHSASRPAFETKRHFPCQPRASVLYLFRAIRGSPSFPATSRRPRGGGKDERVFDVWTAPNPLKSPESDEGIQDNPSPFPWSGLVWICVGLEEFGLMHSADVVGRSRASPSEAVGVHQGQRPERRRRRRGMPLSSRTWQCCVNRASRRGHGDLRQDPDRGLIEVGLNGAPRLNDIEKPFELE